MKHTKNMSESRAFAEIVRQLANQREITASYKEDLRQYKETGLNPEGIKELIEAAKRFSTKDIDGIQEPALFELVSSLQSALER